MKKFSLLFLINLSVLVTAVAQRQNNYYLTNNGKHVSTIDSADYIRVVQEPEKGSAFYPTLEFYRNGNKKSIGYSSRIEPPRYEGQFRSYYMNGNRRQVLNYARGKITDTAYTYYPNGMLYSSSVYNQMKDSSTVYIKTVRDSAGKDLVTDGNGYAVFYDIDFKQVINKGGVKNGRLNGEWSGALIGKDTLNYRETYAEGVMLSGESSDNKGNVYHYTVSEVVPQYKEGPAAFYKYISRSVRYPRSLVSQKIQGIVQVSFTVLSTGEIGEVHAVNQVHPEMAAEAIRVIKSSKPWEPGVQKGRRVNVAYTIPVSFSLSN